MGKRKRKLFTGNKPIGEKPVKSRRVARKITSTFHNIQNELAQIKSKASSGDRGQVSTRAEKDRIAELEMQMKRNGGVDRYQQASVLSTFHFRTSRWVIRSLDQMGHLRRGKHSEKLNVLEVGAINTQMHSCSFMNVKSIDLHSQHPLIEEADFFDIQPCSLYDAVVCSMVINCVPSPIRRSEMLARLSVHLKLDGVLFLVLPKRCLNSIFIGGVGVFLDILNAVGLEEVEDEKLERRESLKLAYFVLRRKKSSLRWINGEERRASYEEVLAEATRQLKTKLGYEKFIVSANTGGETSSNESMMSSVSEFSILFPEI